MADNEMADQPPRNEPADRPVRNRSGRKTQDHVAVRQARDALVKEMMDSERAATDAKTAKLRALRLAKEEADREAARNAPPPPPKASRAKRAR